ncbi:serine/threonine protein kinase [Arcanobacterium bovis]|uniref:non-specific serine/threonine protein kinase n=1 Tax=Arcanobacterium bovis TaxID=2529275 RepID=A0A4Q9V1A5_9ACTO|nr:serine/threonine-protein kinase [Arcanobacterium bovis]TBW22866.1 serine/threonine protein kinase [Arcanobacterium bovis]
MSNQGFDFGASYVLDEIIGEGASGVVWKGHRKGDGAAVAVKILRDQYANDPQILTRFVTERTLLTTLEHDNIVKVLDLVVESGRLGIVMEYVEGETLREVLMRDSVCGLRSAVAIVIETLRALEHAHAHNIVHRDIKPDNILIARGNADISIKLTDFGISKILGEQSKATQVVGTPEYMSPELIEKGIAIPETDVYATGIMFYELLAGRTPFSGGDNAFTIAHRHLSSLPPAIDGLDEKIASVLWTMLEKDPRRRLPAPELIKQLNELIDNLDDSRKLVRQEDVQNYAPATVLKPRLGESENDISSHDTESQEAVRNVPVLLDELSPSTQATVMKPLSADDGTAISNVDRKSSARKADLTGKNGMRAQRHKIVVFAIAGLLLAASVVGVAMFSRSSNGSKEFASEQVSQEDSPLPSGLIISRSAKVDSERNVITYEIKYETHKQALSGVVLETLQDLDGACIEPRWDGQSVTKNSPSQTSLDVPCSFAIGLEPISSGKPHIVSATIPLENLGFSSSQDVSQWLKTTSENTLKNVQNPNMNSTSYPLQRLVGLKMSVPSRVVQGNIVPISVIGIWPNGENQLSPVFISPQVGNPTSVLTDITGANIDSVRFTDRCAGAVAVSQDGRSITSLHPGTCDLEGNIGNFNLTPAKITVTGTGS